MSELHEYIKGKNAAFVGMAPNIMGKGLGDEINSFDLVFRTNIFPIPEEYKVDYGSKCDVISMLKSSAINPDVFSKGGIQWVIHYRPAAKYSPLINYYRMTIDERNKIRIKIYKEIGFDPKHGTAGINIIATVLKSEPKRLKLFGITGYQDKNGNVVDYFKGTQHYIPYFRSKIRPGIVSMKHHPSHNFQVQNDWIRYLLKNGRVEMDPYSLEYFKYN